MDAFDAIAVVSSHKNRRLGSCNDLFRLSDTVIQYIRLALQLCISNKTPSR